MPEDVAAIQERVEALRQEINQHNYRYFVLDDPIVADAEYDALMNELRALEAEHPELQSPDSPTQRVGSGPSEAFGVVEHMIPMLSLANAFNADTLRAWYQRAVNLLGREIKGFVLEPKIDGLAVSLTYKDKQLSIGATRGDGQRGEDVTPNIRTIRSVPLRLNDNPPDQVEVRGEVYYTKTAFERVNEERLAEGQPLFMNARNSAAGTLRQLDPRITARRPLDIFVYSLGYTTGSLPRSHWAVLEMFQNWGLKTNPANRRAETLDEVIDQCEHWEKRREELDYDIDGVVIKIDDFNIQEELGAVGREPRWAIAFKFPPSQATTRLNRIGINVGRTGSLNPYAVLEPVQVAGVTIKLATLHNEEDINRKDIREGDYVIVQRAGEVIPQVIGPVVGRRTGNEVPFKMPTHCPVCGSQVIKPEGEAMHRCTGGSICAAQRYELIKHFVSRGAMDIDGVGEKLVHAMLQAELIHDFSDLYHLTREQVQSLERMAEKSAQNVVDSIEASKRRPLNRVLFALGIRYVGDQTATLLANHFGSMEALMNADEAEILETEGIGPKIAASVYAYFQEPRNRETIHKLREAGLTLEAEKREVVGEQPLAGMAFVVTGTLARHSRLQIESRIKELGGIVSDGVSKKTSYVLVGENPGSKVRRAQQLGTPIINEDEFEELVSEKASAEA
jgi:DNA ligase (NAD+)